MAGAVPADTAPRSFCRFTSPTVPNPTGLDMVPLPGFCLNVFLIVRPPGADGQVLLGKVDPAAPWDRLGALDADRLQRAVGGWMLPSSQLVYGEDPARGVDRLRAELLDSAPMQIAPPRILSEVYPSSRESTPGDHWDLSFLFLARSTSSSPPPAGPWKELRFVDLAATAPSEFVRAHDDVLRAAGLTVGSA